MSEKERNLRVAESISTRFAWNDQTFREGDFLALLDGEILTVAKTPEAAIAVLRAREPDPTRGMVFEVSRPVIDVVRCY